MVRPQPQHPRYDMLDNDLSTILASEALGMMGRVLSRRSETLRCCGAGERSLLRLDLSD